MKISFADDTDNLLIINDNIYGILLPTFSSNVLFNLYFALALSHVRYALGDKYNGPNHNILYGRMINDGTT